MFAALESDAQNSRCECLHIRYVELMKRQVKHHHGNFIQPMGLHPIFICIRKIHMLEHIVISYLELNRIELIAARTPALLLVVRLVYEFQDSGF